jgi:hypothetical protein
MLVGPVVHPADAANGSRGGRRPAVGTGVATDPGLCSARGPAHPAEELGAVSDLLVRWYRLTDRITARRERPTVGELRYGAAARTAIFVTVLSALLAVPVIAVIRVNETRAPSSDAPATRAASPGVQTGGVASPDVRTNGEETSGTEGQLPGFDVHVNKEGGYLFSYPDTWTVSHTGEVTRLLGPTGDVEMTFGIAPSRALEPASDRVVAEVADAYSDVELVTSEVDRTPQGQRSLVVGGTATDAAGDRVRFLVITIQGADQTRAITVRFDAESDPLDSLSVIREVVASFRTSDTG